MVSAEPLSHSLQVLLPKAMEKQCQILSWSHVDIIILWPLKASRQWLNRKTVAFPVTKAAVRSDVPSAATVISNSLRISCGISIPS